MTLSDILLRIGRTNTGISLAVGFWLLFRKQMPLHLKMFPVFTAVTLVFNFVGHKVAQEEGNNHYIYNIFNFILFPFYLFVLWRILNKSWVKKIAFYSIFIFPILTICNILFLQGFYGYNTYTHSLGSVLIVLFSIDCLYELFTNTPTRISPTHLPDFWICMGLLIYYGVSFAAFNAMQAGIQHSKAALKIIGLIMAMCQYCIYISFTIGFYCALNYTPTKDPALTKTNVNQSNSDNPDFLF